MMDQRIAPSDRSMMQGIGHFPFAQNPKYFA
jgi:hypothetical protein